MTCQVKELSRSEIRILYLLSQHREGLCHNDFRRNGIDPTTVKKYESKLTKVLVRIRKERGRGGTKNVYVLTLEGEKCVEMIRYLEEIDKNLKRFFKLSKEDERLRVFSKIIGDLYRIYVKAFHSRGDVEGYRRFFDALTKSMKDIRNERLFGSETKKAILEGKRLGMEYYDPHFVLRVLPIGFIILDAKLAFEMGHYLNRHHVYVLTKFDLQKEKELKKKNEEWLKVNGSLDSDKIKNEIEIRKKEIRKKMPQFKIPEDYGEFLGDVR